jgi:hypothetical protein
MEKRYQVFVSSTYEDLLEERKEVMQALLELDCIPAGMELFPAANDDQWSLIKKVIDDCDYYIVVVGGRYGSIGPEGKSYTQMEYEFAVERGKPVIGFLHKDPSSLPVKKTEREPKSIEKLEAFRDIVQKRMCKYWVTPSELGSVVSRSLIKLIKSYPAVGWVKGDLVPDEGVTNEMLRLRRRIEELEKELSKTPSGTEHLAQGDDIFEFKFHFKGYIGTSSARAKDFSWHLRFTWNELFSQIAPLMIVEAEDLKVRSTLLTYIENKAKPLLKKSPNLPPYKTFKDFKLNEESYQTIIIQLRALNLITKSVRNRSVHDTKTYWTLTPYGDSVMTKIRAITR